MSCPGMHPCTVIHYLWMLSTDICISEKMRVREAIDAASQTYTKKATIEQLDVHDIIHRAVARIKIDVDSEVSIYNEDSRCCGRWWYMTGDGISCHVLSRDASIYSQLISEDHALS